MIDDHDTDEYAAVDSSGPAAGDPDLAYLSSLDAPRWAILLAAAGAAWAGAMMVTEAVRRIAGALGY